MANNALQNIVLRFNRGYKLPQQMGILKFIAPRL